MSIRPDLEYTLSNLAPACWQCNVVRQNRPLEEIQRDPALFRREVEAALERRDIRRARQDTNPAPIFTEAPPERYANRAWAAQQASSRDWL